MWQNFKYVKLKREIFKQRFQSELQQKQELFTDDDWEFSFDMTDDFDTHWEQENEDGEADVSESKQIEVVGPKKNVYEITAEAPPHVSEAAIIYAPPRDTAVFRKYWYDLVSDIVGHPNFKNAHLIQLEQLCNMHEDIEKLQEFVRRKGYTYISVSKFSKSLQAYPEVQLLMKMRTELRNMYKHLGLSMGPVVPASDKDGKHEWK